MGPPRSVQSFKFEVDAMVRLFWFDKTIIDKFFKLDLLQLWRGIQQALAHRFETSYSG